MEISEIEQLIEAVVENNLARIKDLLQKGVDPNDYVDDELRPLHFAAQSNSVDAAQLLITAGADVNARTDPGQETALDIAKLHGHKQFVDFLTNHIYYTETQH